MRQKTRSADRTLCVCPVSNFLFFASCFVHRGPDLYMDWDKMEGQPFAYFTFGVCCSEVELDCLTGEYRVRTGSEPRTDAFSQSRFQDSGVCLFVCLFVVDGEGGHGDGHRQKPEPLGGYRPGVMSNVVLCRRLLDKIKPVQRIR